MIQGAKYCRPQHQKPCDTLQTKYVNLMPNFENRQGEGRGKSKTELKKKAFKHSYWGSKESTSIEWKHAIKILSLGWMKFGLKITKKIKLLKQQNSPPLLTHCLVMAANWNWTLFQKWVTTPPLLQHWKSPEKQNPLTILRRFSVAINYGQTDAITEWHEEWHQNMWHWYTLVPLRKKAQQWTMVSFYHINSKSNH